MMKKEKRLLLAVLLVLIFILSSGSGYALTRLPDIGIDYKTMKVIQAVKIKEAGMTDAKNGDKILMNSNKNGGWLFKNLRTNEILTYPSTVQKERGR